MKVTADIPLLIKRIDKLELTGYAMSAGVDGFVSPQLASKWISDLRKGTSSVTTYLAICKVLDIIEGEAKESVDKSSPSDKVDYSAPKSESKPVYNNPVTVEQKVSQKPPVKPYPIVNTFPQQGDEDDIDLDHENMNTLDYECLSEHLPYVLAPEGKFLKQGGGVVFTHNNRGYKATPSQESPSVVFFEGQEKFKMETGFKGAIIVTKQG